MKKIDLRLFGAFYLSIYILTYGCGPNTGNSNVADSPSTCPDNYVQVPGQSFCISKFAGVSGPEAAVTVSLEQQASWLRCTALGSKYRGIRNTEWQIVARLIESTAVNWSSGTVGTGALNQGHSDNNPGQVLDNPSADETDFCKDTGETCSETVWDSQRRTFKLGDDGPWIWDFAGNAWEWVYETNVLGSDYGADAYMQSVTDITHPATGALSQGDSVSRTAKGHFGPSGDYTALNSSPYGGLGKGYLNYAGGRIARGGAYTSLDESGAFAVVLNRSDTYTSDRYSFRCVYDL